MHVDSLLYEKPVISRTETEDEVLEALLTSFFVRNVFFIRAAIQLEYSCCVITPFDLVFFIVSCISISSSSFSKNKKRTANR